MVYLVTYDLNKEDKDYSGVIQAIKDASTGVWTHCMESTWLIQSSMKSEVEVFNAVKPHLDANDNCLVVRVTEKPMGRLATKRWDYINKNLSFR